MQIEPTTAPSNDITKYGRPVYRIDDPKKFQNETPLIVNEYQTRKIARVPAINSSTTTYFQPGSSIEFVIKGHEYVNFKNSVIYCSLITAGTPGTFIKRPYHTASYIKRLQIFMGGGDPIENINEYGLKESVVSTLMAKPLENDILTFCKCIPDAITPFSRHVACAGAVNTDIANPLGAGNEECHILIPLNCCLTDADYINLYNINDEGIRIVLELNQGANVLTTDGAAVTFWLGNPKLELDVITTTTQNRLSKENFTIRTKTYTQGNFLWPAGTSTISANIQTHNVSVNSILFIDRLAAGVSARAALKMRDALHDGATDVNLVSTTLAIDNSPYPFCRDITARQVKWYALQQYVKKYRMNEISNGKLTSSDYIASIHNDIDYDLWARIAVPIAHTFGFYGYALDTWPQETEIIDGIGGRNSTINVTFNSAAGVGAAGLITYFIGSDLLITIENGNVKTMNR